MADIVIRARYISSSNRIGGIKKWAKYVSKKEKADGVSIDQTNILKDYLNYSDEEMLLSEKEECFLWSFNGNSIIKNDLEKINIDSKGVLWNLVISFDPSFAFNNGLITKNDYFNLTKKIMPSLIIDSDLDLNNVSWFAGLHRNTKNPHIHLILFENKVKSYSKTIPKFAIYNIKSNIVNYLINNTEFYKLRDYEFKNITNKISLDDLNKVKNQSLFSDKYRRDLNKMLLDLYKKLPAKGRLQYNSKNMDAYRTELNFIIDFILLNDPIKNNYEKYYNILEEHQKSLIKVYGHSNDNNNNKYLIEQKNRLYSKIGNEILNNFKIYQSYDNMEREIIFLKKHILNMNFRSDSRYSSDKHIITVGKDLYKICRLCDLNPNQISKVFNNWLNNSKYNYNVDNLLIACKTFDYEMSTTDYYKLLKKLGYDYDRYNKFKDKYFYRELNYKSFINNSIKHLMYEYEREQKSIEKNLEYELESY